MASDADSRLLCGKTTGEIIRSFGLTYDVLGPGFLESVYKEALAFELRDRGLNVMRETALDVWYRGVRVGHFRADLLVSDEVIVEVKAGRGFVDADRKQLFNYLRASNIEVGMLLLYGPKPYFRRYIFENGRKPKTLALRLGRL